jgi:hypothetical protein
MHQGILRTEGETLFSDELIHLRPVAQAGIFHILGDEPDRFEGKQILPT